MNDRVHGQYKLLPFFSILSIGCCILMHLFAEKIVWIEAINAGYFLSPFCFIINDIIAEIYGYKNSMKIFWYTYICENIFSIMLHFFISIDLFHFQNGVYHSIFGFMWYGMLFNSITLWVAWLINSRLITKWKILMKGKYFWLRSIGSSGIAEILFAILMIPYILIIHHNIKEIFSCLIAITIIRLLATILFAFPSELVVNIIKNLEKIDISNNKNNFNPFDKEKPAEI